MGSQTYSTDEDLILDNGKSIDILFDTGITAIERLKMKQLARERAFNFINDRYLRGKTAVPAYHIYAVREIEKDLVIANLLNGAFTMESANTSDWSKKFEERAIEALANLRYGASVETVIPDAQNTGNGDISKVDVNDDFTITETWIIKANSAIKFSVHGSTTGYLRELTVGNQYPEKAWGSTVDDYGFENVLYNALRYEQYPISLKITAGDVAFVDGDKFVFKTYAASFYRKLSGRLIPG